MILKSLSLLNYKNFESQSFEFNDRINCFVGNNGIGKTNVLDAIYHLSFGKSYFNPIASQNIKHHESFFVINGDYEKDGKTEKIAVSLKKGQKKVIKRNNKVYDRFSDHIGFLPLVIISPAKFLIKIFCTKQYVQCRHFGHLQQTIGHLWSGYF